MRVIILLGVLAVISCVTAAETSASNTEVFRQDSVNVHNKYRAKHHSPKLAQNKTLDSYAQNWAQHLANTSSFQHSGGIYGENLYMTSSTKISYSKAVTAAIDAWYDEISEYDYDKPGFSGATGHFTQVVWKKSKNVGIGVARSKSGTYVCASYDPPGNFLGQFPENVLRP